MKYCNRFSTTVLFWTAVSRELIVPESFKCKYQSEITSTFKLDFWWFLWMKKDEKRPKIFHECEEIGMPKIFQICLINWEEIWQLINKCISIWVEFFQKREGQKIVFFYLGSLFWLYKFQSERFSITPKNSIVRNRYFISVCFLK